MLVIFLRLSEIVVYTGCLSQTSVCVYINKEVLSLLLSSLSKTFQFLADKNCIRKSHSIVFQDTVLLHA